MYKLPIGMKDTEINVNKFVDELMPWDEQSLGVKCPVFLTSQEDEFYLQFQDVNEIKTINDDESESITYTIDKTVEETVVKYKTEHQSEIVYDEEAVEPLYDDEGNFVTEDVPVEVPYEEVIKVVKDFDFTEQMNNIISIIQEKINSHDPSTLSDAMLRSLREPELVAIDTYQGVLRYSELTETQQLELASYRTAWLDVTETKVVPERPEWMV